MRPFAPPPLQRLLHYYGRIRPCAWLRYAHLSVSPFASRRQVLLFPIHACHEVMPSLCRLPHRPPTQLRRCWSLICLRNQVLTTSSFSTPLQGFTCVHLLMSYLTGSLGLFLIAHDPSLFTKAASGGLVPASGCRNRGACPHHGYSTENFRFPSGHTKAGCASLSRLTRPVLDAFNNFDDGFSHLSTCRSFS